MAQAKGNILKVHAEREEKKEITYQYVPILWGILGYWKQMNAMMLGSETHLHVATDLLARVDRLYLNGVEIKIDEETWEKLKKTPMVQEL